MVKGEVLLFTDGEGEVCCGLPPIAYSFLPFNEVAMFMNFQKTER